TVVLATVEFAQAEFAVWEDAIGYVVTLTRDADVPLASVVEVQITGGSASAASDYTPAGFPLRITFAPGETEKLVPLPITSDRLVAVAETIQLRVVGISEALIGINSTAQLTIENDDAFTGRVFRDWDNDGLFDLADGDSGLENVSLQLVDEA